MARLVFIGLGLAAIIAGFTGCSDRVRTEFATLDDARAAKASERGWLPPALPGGTTDIVEVNDVESNYGEGSFAFPPESVLAYVDTVRTNFGAGAVFDEQRITMRIQTDRTYWEVVLEPKAGRGRYTVGLNR